MSPPYATVVKTKKKICAKDFTQIAPDLAQIKCSKHYKLVLLMLEICRVPKETSIQDTTEKIYSVYVIVKAMLAAWI